MGFKLLKKLYFIKNINDTLNCGDPGAMHMEHSGDFVFMFLNKNCI